jgi:CHAT domain
MTFVSFFTRRAVRKLVHKHIDDTVLDPKERAKKKRNASLLINGIGITVSLVADDAAGLIDALHSHGIDIDQTAIEHAIDHGSTLAEHANVEYDPDDEDYQQKLIKEPARFANTDPDFAQELKVLAENVNIVHPGCVTIDNESINCSVQGGGNAPIIFNIDSVLGNIISTDDMINKSMKSESIDKMEPHTRHLHARFPERVHVGERLPLQIRVALSPTLDKSTPLRAFYIPPGGANLKLVLESPGFILHTSSIATVHVTSTADSDWVLFELEALYEGVYTLEVLAFNGGAFLGTLSLQLVVDNLVVRAHSIDTVTLLPLRSPQEGEVTLVIRYDHHNCVYRYQFRSTTFGETDELQSGPLRRGQEKAVADLIDLLNGQARELTEYSAEETYRWLQGKGVELWKELIPKELENLFWQQRDNIKCMTILSSGDPMPWEMMYPTNDAGDDAGFLAEQFPIVRWIFGSAPTTQLQCSLPFFVVSDDAPLTAEDELTTLRSIVGEGQNINDLTPLLKLFDNAEFDFLHFACHNIFHVDSPTSSSIQIGSKRFVPTFLNKYNKHFHSPLIFMNACRSDGMAANYTWLAGWAKSFLTAGAGAFIGSLWEVRDSSANRFAETFYQALHSGIPLGDAMKQARTAIQKEPGDPTWLAYTLYGNPAAVLLKDESKVI